MSLMWGKCTRPSPASTLLYCKQLEAGRGPGNEVIESSLPSTHSCTEALQFRLWNQTLPKISVRNDYLRYKCTTFVYICCCSYEHPTEPNDCGFSDDSLPLWNTEHWVMNILKWTMNTFSNVLAVSDSQLSLPKMYQQFQRQKAVEHFHQSSYIISKPMSIGETLSTRAAAL